jgi:hypothetical protein
MKILTLDPGLKNFAYCLAEVSTWSARSLPAVLRTGRFSTILDKKNLTSAVDFCAFIRRFFAENDMGRGDRLCIERYTVRGGFAGRNQAFLAEPINLMIGMVLSAALDRGVDVILETAATWKRWCNERAVMVPEEPRRSQRIGTNVHERDTIGMLLWLWGSRYQMDEESVRRKIRKRLDAKCQERSY